MNARIPSIDVSPEACAARDARIMAANHTRRMRDADMAAARDIRRKHGLRNLNELFLELNTLISAYSCDDDYKQRLRDLCSDMEDDMAPPEAEVLGWEKRGEYDQFTQRSVR